jgi:hypothetical protein
MVDQRLPDRQNLSATASWEMILSIGEVDQHETIFNSMIVVKDSTRYSYRILGELIQSWPEREVVPVFELRTERWPDSTVQISLPIENGRINISNIRDLIDIPFIRSEPGYILGRGVFNSNMIDYSHTMANDNIVTPDGTIYSKITNYSVILRRDQ